MMFDGDSTDGCDLTLVIPFYNPGPRFGSHLQEIIAVLSASNITYEIIAVSDGSSAASEEEVSRLISYNLKFIKAHVNQGKGSALRAGLASGKGDYLGFIDADGDLPAPLLLNAVEVIRIQSPDVIYGSKRHPNSGVIYPPLRRIYSWSYQQLNKLLFNLPVRDTQTGLKFLRRDVLEVILPMMIEKRFAFDLELFVVANHSGFKNFVEIPVTIIERFSSTVSFKTILRMLVDTFAIFYRLRITRYYSKSSVNYE